jgi:hypothetical protein
VEIRHREHTRLHVPGTEPPKELHTWHITASGIIVVRR